MYKSISLVLAFIEGDQSGNQQAQMSIYVSFLSFLQG